MTFRPNYRSHNQPSPPRGWLDRLRPERAARYAGPFGADWYKYRTDKNGKPLGATERRRFKRLRMLMRESAYSTEFLREDRAMFDRYLETQFEPFEPRLPQWPVVEWLAVQLYYWYGPLRWSVDLTAADWVEQLHAADERNSYSFAECEAQASKWGYLMPPEEIAILRKITRNRGNNIPYTDK